MDSGRDFAATGAAFTRRLGGGGDNCGERGSVATCTTTTAGAGAFVNLPYKFVHHAMWNLKY